MMHSLSYQKALIKTVKISIADRSWALSVPKRDIDQQLLAMHIDNVAERPIAATGEVQADAALSYLQISNV
jgi:hypothetical protein